MPQRTPAAATRQTPLSTDELAALAYEIRQRSLRMVYEAGMGHTGGDFSSAEIVTTLYFGGVLNVDPARPNDPHRDRFILSKGHSCGTLYTVLAYAGFFPKEELETFMQPHARLSGHPNRTYVPGVEANTGPLGHGLPIAVGAALAAQKAPAALPDKAAWRVFVLTGDGELQEGSNWEAGMAASQFGLDNLTLIVDRNGLQQGDRTERTVGLEPLAQRWRAFGWAVREVDGHDPAALLTVTGQLPFEPGKPNCIIARTHKGQGLATIRDQARSHHYVPKSREEYEAAVDLLTKAAPHKEVTP
jgi:transketolase